jgi:hypothetical protein
MKRTLTCVPIIVVIPIILGVSLCCGFTVGGLGSFSPQLIQVAKPIACGSDAMQVEQHVYSYKPGSTSYTITVYCVDGTTGAKKDVTNLAQFSAGLIYSVSLFVALLVVIFVVYLVVFLVVWGTNSIRRHRATAHD